MQQLQGLSFVPKKIIINAATTDADRYGRLGIQDDVRMTWSETKTPFLRSIIIH